jgi:Zn-dependent M28 family amino/carboxypeptidase
LAGCGGGGGSAQADRFDSARAFREIESQVAVGQRPAGSPQLRQLARQLRAELPHGRFEQIPGHPGLRNVVGVLPGSGPAIVIGAHYDSEAHPPGFVGANDSAAGTAAVIELSRDLRRGLPKRHREIRFVLFDGEEEPLGCPDSQFQSCALRGSKAYARRHAGEVGQLVLLDYIANKGLQIPREALSNRRLWARLRAAAARVGAAAYFPDRTGEGVIDDDVPFLQQHVPSIDLIDFSYAYADGIEDTPDKLSPEALDAVGETVAELAVELASPQGPQS